MRTTVHTVLKSVNSLLNAYSRRRRFTKYVQSGVEVNVVLRAAGLNIPHLGKTYLI